MFNRDLGYHFSVLKKYELQQSKLYDNYHRGTLISLSVLLVTNGEAFSIS